MSETTGLCCRNYLRLKTAANFVLYFEVTNLLTLVSYIAAISARPDIKCCSAQLVPLFGSVLQTLLCLILMKGLKRGRTRWLEVSMFFFLVRSISCLVVFVIGFASKFIIQTQG
ncbi:hypothetical protein Ddc_10061 [Ditylenchus destructor]|nr:hypothetical protein Ddc_10061 [Ditylenchus destructor]